MGGAANSKKDRENKLYSMEKSLDIMVKKTKDEAENFLREVKKIEFILQFLPIRSLFLLY